MNVNAIAHVDGYMMPRRGIGLLGACLVTV